MDGVVYFINTLIALQWKEQHLQSQQKYIRRLMKKLQYIQGTTPSKICEQFFDEVYCILNLLHLKSYFNHINNLHRNIKFTKEGESNAELVFLDTSLKRSKCSLYRYIGSLNILTNV